MKTDKPKKPYAIALLFALVVGASVLALRGIESTTPPVPPQPAARAGDGPTRVPVETAAKAQVGEPAPSLHKIPQ